MENIQVTINLPKTYFKAIELAVESFSDKITVEEYILECLRSGLEVDVFEALEYEQMSSKCQMYSKCTRV